MILSRHRENQYIKKAAETLLMQNAHSNTSKTQVGQPSNNSLSQKLENVNKNRNKDSRYSITVPIGM
jgi:hypothetical protein